MANTSLRHSIFAAAATALVFYASPVHSQEANETPIHSPAPSTLNGLAAPNFTILVDPTAASSADAVLIPPTRPAPASLPDWTQYLKDNTSVVFFPYAIHLMPGLKPVACGGNYLAQDPLWNGQPYYDCHTNGIGAALNLEPLTGVQGLSVGYLKCVNSLDRGFDILAAEYDFDLGRVASFMKGWKLGGVAGLDLADSYRTSLKIGGRKVPFPFAAAGTFTADLAEITGWKSLQGWSTEWVLLPCLSQVSGQAKGIRCDMAITGGVKITPGLIFDNLVKTSADTVATPPPASVAPPPRPAQRKKIRTPRAASWRPAA
jgi:hypothetical protein